MSFENLLLNIGDDGVALATINRPEKRNALNRRLLGELEEMLSGIESDTSVRGLILAGAGEKAFAGGADLAEIAALGPEQARRFSEYGQRVLRRLERMAKPSVAAIQGYALGGGLELALACWFRIASPEAKFGLPEVKLGLIPGFGGTQRLPRLVGRARAMEMILSGRTVDAAEAAAAGLVHRIVPREELLAACRALVLEVAGNAPLAVALAARAVEIGSSLDPGLEFEAAAFGLAAATEDAREGLRAFLEKRPPSFAGK